MKKLLGLALCVSFAVGMSSCAKETCYECTTSSSSDCTVNICDKSVSTDGNCAGFSVSVPNATNEDLKKGYEAIGFTCTAK